MSYSKIEMKESDTVPKEMRHVKEKKGEREGKHEAWVLMHEVPPAQNLTWCSAQLVRGDVPRCI